MRELMTHTAGFTYGNFGAHWSTKWYHDLNLVDARISRSGSTDWPGPPALSARQWLDLRPSMDIQGYIVEKLSGQSLPDFMRDQIFSPWL